MKQFQHILKSIYSLIIIATLPACIGKIKSTSENTKSQNQDTSIALPNSIWVVYQDQNKTYWYGSNGNGIFSWDGKKLKQYTNNDGLCDNQIRGIQEDLIGNVYFDTRAGVSVFDGKTFKTLNPVRGNTRNWQLKPHDLWFKGNGETNFIYRYDGDTLFALKFSDIDEKELNDAHCVYNIYKDKTGFIWFGTLSSGVCRFNGKKLDWIFEKELSVLKDGRVPAVRSIIEDKEGYFWLSNTINKYQINLPLTTSSSFGYKKLEGLNLQDPPINISLPYFTSAIIDKENKSVWMSSYNDGVWHNDGDNLNIIHLKNGHTPVLIVSIYQDLYGQIWLGTDNFGLYKYNGKTFDSFQP